MKKESDVARSSNNERPPEGVAASKRSGNPFTGMVGSPAPTQHYSPTEIGPDDVDYFEPGDHYVPDEQDRGDGGRPPTHHLIPITSLRIRVTSCPEKNKGGSGPPDGDDGDGGDPDDDDDEKFRRRMIKFLGGFVDQKNDDKPKVKEADTIKIPAFPLAETYRNGRIKTREAVVAASTDPDSAFKWVSESWKEHDSGRLRRLRHLMQNYFLLSQTLSQVTSPVRLIPSRKPKPQLDGLYGEDTYCSCFMTISAQTSNMEPLMPFKICSLFSCVGKI